jgi:hypothetical protein
MWVFPADRPFILDKATSTYVLAMPYLKAWAERECQAAENRRAKAVQKGDQRDRQIAIGARDAYSDVLRELGRVEYK